MMRHTPELVIPNRLIVATDNPRKAKAYGRYPFDRIHSIGPEKTLGQPESDSSDPKYVAHKKTETVRRSLERTYPGIDHYVVTGNDVTTFHARTLEDLMDPSKRREFKKLSRNLVDLDSEAEKQHVIDQAKIETQEMFCLNGQFCVLWILGTSVQVPSLDISNTAEVKIVGCFNALHQDEVVKAFQDGSALEIGPRVPLAQIADQYAEKILLVDNDVMVPIDSKLLWQLTVEGVLPFTTFSTLLQKSDQKPRHLPYQKMPIKLAS